jgi:xanthine dehydrogenase YagS FAD-binding subunit
VPAEDYFIGPGTDITRLTMLRPGDLLTAVRIPGTWGGARFYFEKVRDRNVWDFALVSIASAMVVSAGAIERIRLVVNGVSARPRRLVDAEQAAVGRPPNEATAVIAGNLAIRGAQPLRHNAYKVPLTRNLVKRAIRGVEDVSWTS